MKFKKCDIYHLKEMTQKKKLVCFGMGQVLKDFLEDFAFMEFEKTIFSIADNKIKGSGSHILLNGCEIPLISVQKLIDLQGIIILISCADISGVYEQLNRFESLQDTECFAVYYIRSQTNKIEEQNRYYPTSFRLTKEQKIPKLIHYCWFGNNPIPEHCLKWMETWKKHCPDYDIVRWDESNYDVAQNAYMYEAYQAQKWAFVSDYARVDIVYRHGGIYLDVDVEMLRSYDELLYQSAFCGIESSRKIALGLGFGAEKGHAVLKGVLDLYGGRHFKDTEGRLDFTTCVRLQDSCYKKGGFIANGDYQIFNGMTVYPESVLSPKDLYTGEVSVTDHSFSIHHYDASWVENKGKSTVEAARRLYKQLWGSQQSL